MRVGNESQQWRAMRAFVRLAELETFTAVAAEMGVRQPTVTKWIAGLEAHLGTALLHRTTRSHSLTEAGRVYLGYCRRILATIDEAESHVRGLQGDASGTLRATIPMAFGRLFVVPTLPRFLERHPRITLDLEMSDGRVDLVRDGFDLAIRIGNLPDSTLRSTRLGLTRRLVVASPAYFAQRGRPSHPEELADHACLLYTRTARPETWRFARGGEPLDVRVGGRFRANNGEALREVALAGGGVAMLASWLVGPDVRRGALEVVLDAYSPPPLDMRAVYPAAEHVPPKTTAFIEHVRGALANADGAGVPPRR